jgi:hypothetical protein
MIFIATYVPIKGVQVLFGHQKQHNPPLISCLHWAFMLQPHFEGVWKWHSHHEMGTWESFGTPENSEFNCRGQNTSPWSVFYTVGEVLKCRCRKWPCMSHSDICSTSYVWKKGQESNWQFDSRPLKVGNRPDAGVCRQSATHHWKALKESYKFALDLIPIGGLNEELWAAKVLGVQTGTVSRLLLGSPGKKCHWDVGATE